MQKENLYIIGDAEQKLKTVASGSVRLIYIDPPYNTGSKFITTINAPKMNGQSLWSLSWLILGAY